MVVVVPEPGQEAVVQVIRVEQEPERELRARVGRAEPVQAVALMALLRVDIPVQFQWVVVPGIVVPQAGVEVRVALPGADTDIQLVVPVAAVALVGPVLQGR